MPGAERPPGLIERYQQKLQLRHYARRMVGIYTQWIRRFAARQIPLFCLCRCSMVEFAASVSVRSFLGWIAIDYKSAERATSASADFLYWSASCSVNDHRYGFQLESECSVSLCCKWHSSEAESMNSALAQKKTALGPSLLTEGRTSVQFALVACNRARAF